MNLGQRILRLARQRVAGSLRGLSGRRDASPEAEELEGFLKDAQRRTVQAPRQPGATASGGAAQSNRPSGSTRASAPGGAQSGRATQTPPPGPGPSARPKTPPPHPYAAEYRVLGLTPGADPDAVRNAWRRLVRENHPDRFAHDPAAQRQATERLRAINEAHDALKRHLEGRMQGRG